jgi:hypothetical protein
MLNKLFTNILIFGLALNSAIFLFGAFGFDPQVQMTFANLSTWTGWFNLSPFNILFTGAAATIIGLAALLTRNGTYAIYAMLLAALGMIITPVQQFVTAIPTAIGTLIPPETNPNPTLFPINPLVVVINLVFLFAAFWFIFGLVVQRDIG